MVVEIPYVILNLLFILPMVLNNMLLYYTIYVELMKGGGFKEISGSFYLALGVSSAIAIYSSYAQSSSEIITLVELIEKVVKTRKFTVLYEKFTLCLCNTVTLFSYAVWRPFWRMYYVHSTTSAKTASHSATFFLR